MENWSHRKSAFTDPVNSDDTAKRMNPIKTTAIMHNAEAIAKGSAVIISPRLQQVVRRALLFVVRHVAERTEASAVR